jgi:hypothetical protein
MCFSFSELVCRWDRVILRQWYTRKLINQSEYDELRAKILRWYTERLFGEQPSVSRRHKPKGDEQTSP